MPKPLSVAESFQEQSFNAVIEMLQERNAVIEDISAETVNHYELPQGAVLVVCLQDGEPTDPGVTDWIVNLNNHDSFSLQEGVDFRVLFKLDEDEVGAMLLPRFYDDPCEQEEMSVE